MTAKAQIGAVVLARSDSSRLPGKILADVNGQPLIWYLAQKLSRELFCGPVILATTDRAVDDELAEVAVGLGLKIFRGDCADVAGRLVAAARALGCEAVFRVNGDSPFIDARLIERARKAYLMSHVDLVTNLRPRSYPYGVSAELIRVQALAECLLGGSDDSDREHVTAALYRSLPDDRILNLDNDLPSLHLGSEQVRLTVDTEDDLRKFRAFVTARLQPWSAITYHDALASSTYSQPDSRTEFE